MLPCSSASASGAAKPTVVLVHGAWADASHVDIYIKAENFRETLAGDDLPKKDAAVLADTQRPLSLAAATTATAWKTIRSWYLLGSEDRAITPAAQRLMAERAGATIVEVRASHLSLISRPRKVAELIEEAAAATSQG